MAEHELKPYMGYSRFAGPQECAILIFAHNHREARKVGYKSVMFFCGCPYTDVGVRLLRNKEHLYQQAQSETEPHVIDAPQSCECCGLWGHPEPLVDGECAGCRALAKGGSS